MFTSSSTETFDIARSRMRARVRKESMQSNISTSSKVQAKAKGKGKQREEIPLEVLSSPPPTPHLPSVFVAETFSTPLLPQGGRVWSYAGRLALRLFLDDTHQRPRIHARHLGRRGRGEEAVFDALLTHPVVYSEEPVGCSLWLEEPEEEVRGWCFRFDDPFTARQFSTLATLLTEHDPLIRRNVRRIEAGEWAYGYGDEGAEEGESEYAQEGTRGRAAGGSWGSGRMSWLSSRS